MSFLAGIFKILIKFTNFECAQPNHRHYLNDIWKQSNCQKVNRRKAMKTISFLVKNALN